MQKGKDNFQESSKGEPYRVIVAVPTSNRQTYGAGFSKKTPTPSMCRISGVRPRSEGKS
jgi:hypothetical protein